MPPTCSRFRRSASLVLVALLAQAGAAGSCRAETFVDGQVAGPFVCRADFSLARMGGLFNDLAQLQTDLVRTLGIRPAREPIALYLFRDQSSYRKYLARYLPDVPYRRALYVKREGAGMVFAYFSRQFDIDVRHECTHALLHASLPMVPLWLDEGLAEYFEVSPSERAYANPHLSSIRWYVRLGISPRLENLESKGDISELGGSEYRNAWAWTHFMLHGPPEAHDELVRFLTDIQASTPPGLMSRRLQQRVPNLQRHFMTHFKGWKR